MTVQLQKATQYHREQLWQYSLLLHADQIIAQMWSNGVRGATPEYGMETSANATAESNRWYWRNNLLILLQKWEELERLISI